MLSNPNADDALDCNIAAIYKHERETFNKNALKEKADYAKPTIEEIL